MAPKGSKKNFCITKAHTWLTVLLVSTMIRHYLFMTVHFHRDILFNVNSSFSS